MSIEEESLEQETEREENPYIAKFAAFFESLYRKEIEKNE